MSQPGFESTSPTVLTKRSPWNIYTVMLLIALVALLLAMILFYLEIRRYGGFGAVGGPLGYVAPAPSSLAPLWA